MSTPEYLDHQATQGQQNRKAETIVGVVRFDVTIRGSNGAEIDAGVLTAPLRAGAKDGKLKVEPADLRAAFAEALDTAGEGR